MQFSELQNVPRGPSEWATLQPEKAAYIMAGTGVSVSYRELDEASNQIAHVFRNLGLEAGDHIALLSGNNEHFIKIVWAAQRSGLIYTPIHTHLKADEVEYILKDCGAKLLIFSDQFLELVCALANRETALENILCIESSGQFIDLISEMSRQPVTPIKDQLAGAHMLYSSGTTGNPKGILPDWEPRSFDGFPEALLNTGALLGISKTSVYMAPAPLYHAAPLVSNLVAMAFGGTTVIVEKFEPESALAAIEKYSVTHSQWVPIMFIRMLRLPEPVRKSFDISSMQQATHAAAPCPVEVKQQMIDWWGPIIAEYYSASEAIGMTFITSEEWIAHRGSVGRAVFGTPHIVDSDGSSLPPGETGKIYFSGTQRFEYFNDADKTLSAMNEKFGATVGDIGYMDEDGYLYLTDRDSFVIISGGVNIYPQEIEAILMRHPDILDAAVFGIPNEEFGEEVKAVIELCDWKMACEEKRDEIIGWSRERISSVKTPRSIDFVAALPRRENGKLYKNELRKSYWPT